MSIASNFPAIKPTLLLDFANTEELDSRITFTRASTATYYGTQTAKAEENLLTYSQEFDNAVWGKDKGSLTANTTAAPDGTTTADTFTEDSTNDVHRINFGGTGAPAGVVTCSAFVKAGTGTRYPTVGIASGNSAYASATFDLSAGTNTQTLSAGYSGVSGSIQNVGGGWYRCVLTVTTNAVANFYVALSDSSTFVNGYRGAQIYTGDSASSLIFWGAQLEQRSAVSAYTPTTTQAITNYIPQLLTAASGVARFDHNPTTFESLGLLIEESRTNLVTYSEQFDNAAWTKNSSTITANTIVSPDGTLDADKLVSNSGLTGNIGRGSISFTSGTAVTASFYAKKGEFDTILLRVGSSAFTGTVGARTVTFNLTSGTVTTTGATWTSGSMTAVGNGWYRCIGTVTPTSTASDTLFLSGNNTGDGYSGIYIWGAQLEAGAFATSYIPTVASQVTRAADAASMTGTNFSSWYNQAEGTLYAESRCPNGIVSNLNRITSLNDGTTSNRIELDTGSGASTVGRITTNGTSQGSFSAGSYTDFQLRKSALAIQVDNFTLAANTSTSSDTSALVPVVDRLMIGQSPVTSSSYLNGTMAKLAYYPIRLTNTQLQALTS